ncbi:MAG: muconolactone Delta-isomerase family protein [Thermoproteota archaeon]|nr:muconolactone Delta-isomerase family protein [Thermoproteota archaeon]
MVRPSLEALSKMADDKKMGGVFAGQRRGVVIMIIDASSHEELGKTLAGLPFWSRLTWNVMPLESYRSAIERDRKAMENLKHSKS